MVRLVTLSILRILPLPKQRVEALEILRSVQGRIQAQPGCASCRIYEERGLGQAVLFCEEWESEAALHQHVRSDLYRRILAAVELSKGPPEFSFHHVASTHGMELVEQLRGRTGEASSGDSVAFNNHQ